MLERAPLLSESRRKRGTGVDGVCAPSEGSGRFRARSGGVGTHRGVSTPLPLHPEGVVSASFVGPHRPLHVALQPTGTTSTAAFGEFSRTCFFCDFRLHRVCVASFSILWTDHDLYDLFLLDDVLSR